MSEERVFAYLPPAHAALARETYRRERGADECLSELRLRVSRAASLTLYGGGKSRNLPLPLSLTEAEMREVFSRVCGGSLYAYEESLRDGFLTVDGGVRVGACGTAVTGEGKISSLASVTSLVFRVPHRVERAADGVLALFRRTRRGILLFSPPGGGKTTALRAFAERVSRGKEGLRTAVIDTRGELACLSRESMVDILSGYPKARGAEIAVRTLSPEVLVMDEIGAEEVASLLSLSALGVPLVASAHAETAEELRQSAVGALFSRGVFASLWSVREGREAVP